MANFNQVILIGRLSRDPQFRVLPSSQTSLCDFSLASNSKYKTKSGESREEVLFVDCVAFGSLAETINKFCRKGKELQIVGRLKLDTWEDKQGGGKRSKHSIVIDSFQFLGVKDEETSSESKAGRSKPGPAPGENDGFEERDIPF